MQLNKKSKITWVNGGDNGKKNPMRSKVRMISPQGNVYELSTATGKSIDSQEYNPYGNLKVQQKLAKGHKIYEETKGREQVIKERQSAQAAHCADYDKLFQSKTDQALERWADAQVAETTKANSGRAASKE